MNVLHIFPKNKVTSKNESKGDEMKYPKLVGNIFIFLVLLKGFVVRNHCHCCVPKTHLFVPLLLPCTVSKLSRDVSEREVNIVCFSCFR